MSIRCYDCRRPIEYCLCKYIVPICTNARFIFLMHPKEAKHQKTGTLRICHKALTNSQVLVGVDFSDNDTVNALLSNPKYFSCVLYPNSNALTAFSPELKEVSHNKKLLVFVLDGTWFCAKKIMQCSKNLHNLPCLSFALKYQSIYTFKKEPNLQYVSTIESCYYLINELQSAGLENKKLETKSMMIAFKKMIKTQLEAQNIRIQTGKASTHKKDLYYTTLKVIPDYLDT